MKRFTVKGLVPGLGLVVHRIRAQDADAAWARFCAAYAKRGECTKQTIYEGMW